MKTIIFTLLLVLTSINTGYCEDFKKMFYCKGKVVDADLDFIKDDDVTIKIAYDRIRHGNLVILEGDYIQPNIKQDLIGLQKIYGKGQISYRFKRTSVDNSEVVSDFYVLSIGTNEYSLVGTTIGSTGGNNGGVIHVKTYDKKMPFQMFISGPNVYCTGFCE